jgi:hypothetical protein
MTEYEQHDWESVYDEFSHESGYWNYSRCKNCGMQTESYNRSNFEERRIVEAKCDEFDCYDNDE